MALRQNAKLLIDFCNYTCYGGFARTGITGKYAMIGQRRNLQALLFPHLLDADEIDESRNLFLDPFQTDQAVKFIYGAGVRCDAGNRHGNRRIE